jgi:hypothetical protein
MPYTLPTFVDAPSTTTPVDAANLDEYTTAINDLDSRVTANTTSIASKVASVANADGTITMGGTSTAPTVAVNAIAQSQVTGLPAVLGQGLSPGGVWVSNVYGNQFENMERDDATGSLAMVVSSSDTWIVLLGLCPASTYASFKLYVTTAGTSSTLTAALFGASTLTNTSWARLGSGNVTPVISATGLVSTSLAFTLASPTYVALQMVLTTVSTQPAFAAGGVVPAGLLNPASGCPVLGTKNATTAPGSTLNPTTGFTAGTQKIWCALA